MSEIRKVRKAIVAGQFYPSDKKELENFVKKFVGRKENILAGIVPHAGYVFSGLFLMQVMFFLENWQEKF